MDVFLLVGLPFVTFLIPVAWAAYGIGGSGADPFRKPVRPPGRVRVRRTLLLVAAASVTALGAAAAASADAFGRTTDAGFVIDPAALIFALEAVADLGLIAVVILPGWSNRRAWALRMMGIYWLCLAAPIWILADAGPGWLSTDPASGIFFLGLPVAALEATAALLPMLLIWIAAMGGSRADDSAAEADAENGPDTVGAARL
jgi:hypothetical protein